MCSLGSITAGQFDSVLADGFGCSKFFSFFLNSWLLVKEKNLNVVFDIRHIFFFKSNEGKAERS